MELVRDGTDLLRDATLQPVDSAGNMLRHRARGARRALFRSKSDRSYLESYSLPSVVCAEIWLAILVFNFSRPYKRRAESGKVPAEALRLSRPKEFTIKGVEEADHLQPAERGTRRVGTRGRTAEERRKRWLEQKERERKADPLRRFADVAWTFRLGITHAERMTRWLRRLERPPGHDPCRPWRRSTCDCPLPRGVGRTGLTSPPSPPVSKPPPLCASPIVVRVRTVVRIPLAPTIWNESPCFVCELHASPRWNTRELSQYVGR